LRFIDLNNLVVVGKPLSSICNSLFQAIRWIRNHFPKFFFGGRKS